MGDAIGAELRDHADAKAARDLHHQTVAEKLARCEDLLRRIALRQAFGSAILGDELREELKPWSP